jgi:rare lipoprotein A
MRLPASRRFGARFLTAAVGVLAVSGSALAREPQPLPAPLNGPQADYPVVIGAAYSVQGTNFSPEDTMNYDQVGFVAADRAGGNAVSGSHHTLPLPSYVEVTSLATGRTILVRLERRGPMDATDLVALSPGALTQLGAQAGTPVRVRRVNPPEDQRALLRTGQSAPLRMDTPMSLVEVLKRKLPGQGSVSVAASGPVAGPGATVRALAPVPLTTAGIAAQASSPRPVTTPIASFTPSPSRPATVPVRATPVPALPPLEAPREPAVAQATPRPAAPPATAPRAQTTHAGKFMVQAAAFSTADRAHRAAGVLHGQVVAAGNVFRVRTGPFPTRGEAEASLAKVRAAGYSDARIQTSG